MYMKHTTIQPYYNPYCVVDIIIIVVVVIVGISITAIIINNNK